MGHFSESWPFWRLVRNLNAMHAYGGMVLSISGAPATMNGVDTTYDLINVFDTISASTSDDIAGGIGVELSPNYRLTVNEAGDYRIEFWASFSSSAGGALVTFAPHIGGTIGTIEADRDVAALDTGSASLSGIFTYAKGDTIDVRVKVDTGTSNLSFLGAGLSIHRVG